MLETTRLVAVDPSAIAEMAVSSLQSEALLTPKPGLVDRRGPGSHADMDLEMLLRSAESLRAAFAALALAGSQRLAGQVLRDRVGVIGRAGEAAMLEATGGVNTHRGALWTVGLLVTGAGATANELEILGVAAALAGTPDSAAVSRRPSHGQIAMRAYGVRGAAGEAAAGFPGIARTALPALRASRSRGEDDDRAQLRALLALIASVDDTCVLHRGGRPALDWMQRSAGRVQRARRFDSALARFAGRASRRGLSPGGSADLLAGAIFLDSLNRSRGGTARAAAHSATLRSSSHADA